MYSVYYYYYLIYGEMFCRILHVCSLLRAIIHMYQCILVNVQYQCMYVHVPIINVQYMCIFQEEQSGGGSHNYDVELVHLREGHRDIFRAGTNTNVHVHIDDM